MNLLSVCLNAFLAVMVLLCALAVMIRLLIEIFPERPAPAPVPTGDPVIAAVISAAVRQVHPGTRVTRIEEIK